jgi:hypothetical protein
MTLPHFLFSEFDAHLRTGYRHWTVRWGQVAIAFQRRTGVEDFHPRCAYRMRSIVRVPGAVPQALARHHRVADVGQPGGYYRELRFGVNESSLKLATQEAWSCGSLIGPHSFLTRLAR